MAQKKIFSTKKIILIGVMAALVFIGSKFSIEIPLAVSNTRLHLGNVFCLLSGFLLGGVGGGLAAGIGSAFFDLTNPLYVASTPFTLVFKFIMGFTCGKIAYLNDKKGLDIKFNIIGGISGLLAYIILHLSKSFLEAVWFLNTEIPVALINVSQKGLVSSINALAAIIVAVPLGLAIKASLERSQINFD